MYNQELKTQFIKQYTTSINLRKACVTVFNALEPYEVKWGADLCTQPPEVLTPIINEALGIRSTSAHMRLDALTEYVRWCIKNGVPGAIDGMSGVVISAVEKMKRQTVTSPLHLQKYLNQICEPESEKTTDNIYRCFYWLAYGGVPETDILKIKKSDVDFQSMTVRFNDTEYPIYREAIPAFRNCVNLEMFVYKHPNYSADKTVYKARAIGDTLVRGIRSLPTLHSMRVELARRSTKFINAGKTEMNLSYYRVWISGMFYRMYERERAGFPVDFSKASEKFTFGKTYKFDKARYSLTAYQHKIAKTYLQDYENWKQTFK